MTPAELARQAAEAVRALNHATLTGGYVTPSDVDAVVAVLEALAQRLPQALRQAATWLEAEHDAGRVGVDDTDEVLLAMAKVTGGFGAAIGAASTLHAVLRGLHHETAHLTGTEGP